MKNQINGIVVLNKPSGMTSMSAVKRTQFKLNAVKAGHLGTLDPYASGVLVIALGNATKLFDEHLKEKKTYLTCFRFNIQTDTFDSEGKIVTDKNTILNINQIKNACKQFLGEINQIPPKFSAKKVHGKKAYELARKNLEFELKPKLVKIEKFELISKVKKDIFMFEIVCSSGTYIRSLCRDLGEKLGTCATMVSLIRLQSGKFDISQSLTFDEINEKSVIQA